MTQSTSDGKEIVMTSLFPQGVYLCFSGAGDTAAGRGAGTAFVANATAPGTQRIEWNYSDYVYMSGGSCTWDNALAGDSITFGITAKATTYQPAVPGSGLLNGTLNATTGMITPVAGSVDITNAVPVPNSSNAGAWVWNEPLTGKGTLSARTPDIDPQAVWTYDLYVVDVLLARYVNAYQIYGTRSRDFTLPAIKPQLVLPQWTNFAQIVSASVHSPPLVVTWGITLARNSTN